MTMPADPTAMAADRAALRLIEQSPPTTPAEQRALVAEIDRTVVLPLVATPPSIETRDVTVTVPGRDGVRVRVYLPDAPPVGLYLFFFGGAFRQGGIDFPSVDALLRARAQLSRTVIIAPDYALSPEHRYPVALEQGVAVLRWMAATAGEYDLAPSDITVGGASAGGNLAAAVALVNRGTDRFALKQQILEVPVTDLTGGHLSADVAPEFGLDPAAMVPMMQEMAANYLGDGDPRTATVSPLLADDLGGLPPAHVLTAHHDVFRGDGEAYAAALRSAGTPATLHPFEDMTHSSLALTGAVEGARTWQRLIVSLLDPDATSD